MREGTLVVVVSRAADLHNKRSVSKQNPFCAVRIQNLVHKTKTIPRGGQNPAWDFEARFKLHEDLDSRFLKISVFDQNGSNVDLIGDCSIDLGPAFSASVDEGYDAWHNITFGGKSTGKIYLEVTFYPKHRRQSRANASMTASQTSFRQGLSPSASMSSLSSIGSMGSRRPLPSLPNALGNSGSSLTGSPVSRSPSPVRQAPQPRAPPGMDPNMSVPSLGDYSHRHADVDLANCSLPDLRPTMPKYGARPQSPSRSPQMHTNLTRIPHSNSARSLRDSYVPRHHDLHLYDDDYDRQSPGHGQIDSDEDLDIPEPPQHAHVPPAKGFSFDLQPHISPVGSPEPKEKKNVSHINAWYGKAMFQRFKK